MLVTCITTVALPTYAARAWASRTPDEVALIVVSGDLKGPATYDLPNTVFLDLQEQMEGPFRLARMLPTGHYCRKNIAYLEAMRRGAICIYETDDDNTPLPSWAPRDETVNGSRVVAHHSPGVSLQSRWVNVYRYFTGELIWPRGLPLDEIHTPVPESGTRGAVNGGVLRAPIQQGLVNGSPDVDAVWRLTMDRPFEFENRPSVYLKPGNWCPFNTQSTWWWPVVYPLLYIPSHCSFRMCDIWKSFVAQRCLWELGLGVVFHAPEVFQARNPHDLMRDFGDEISGYQSNRKMARILDEVPLKGGEDEVGGNLMRCYERLVQAGLFPRDELTLVTAWLESVQDLTGMGRPG